MSLMFNSEMTYDRLNFSEIQEFINKQFSGMTEYKGEPLIAHLYAVMNRAVDFYLKNKEHPLLNDIPVSHVSCVALLHEFQLLHDDTKREIAQKLPVCVVEDIEATKNTRVSHKQHIQTLVMCGAIASLIAMWADACEHTKQRIQDISDTAMYDRRSWKKYTTIRNSVFTLFRDYYKFSM